MFPFPGYHPRGYNPHQMDDDPGPIPDSVLQKAKLAGAHKISKDGQTIYGYRYGQILQADWIPEDLDFGAWRAEDTVKVPADAVEIK